MSLLSFNFSVCQTKPTHSQNLLSLPYNLFSPYGFSHAKCLFYKHVKETQQMHSTFFSNKLKAERMAACKIAHVQICPFDFSKDMQ